MAHMSQRQHGSSAVDAAPSDVAEVSQGGLRTALRRGPATMQTRAALGAVLLAGLLSLAVFGAMPVLGPSAGQILAGALVSLAAVLGVAMYVGNTGVLSFGHVAFMALGAYASGLLTMPVAVKEIVLPELSGPLASVTLPVVPAALVGVGVVAIAATITGVVIARLSGGAGVIATLGLLVIVNVVLVGWSDVTRGNQPLYGIPRSLTLPVAAALAVTLVVVARLFAVSRIGLRARASREDEAAAAAIGIGVVGHRMAAWIVSAVPLALAGAMFAHLIGAFSPKEFYFTLTLTLLTMLIVGGMHSVTGAVVGTAVVTALVEVLRRTEGGLDVGPLTLGPLFGLTDIGLAAAILLAMRFRPDGLLGYRELDDIVFRRQHTPVANVAETAVDIDTATERWLAARDIIRHFDGVTALDGVSIELRGGEIVGLIGPNGSGKSTLLAVLSGLLAPSSGHVSLGEGERAGGRDITGMRSHHIARLGVGRTFQNIRLFDHLTVIENVKVALVSGDRRSRPARPDDAAWHLLARFGIADLATRRAATLSYGDQRRLEIARALASRPQFLLLDEPAAGMNHEESDRLLGLLHEIRDEHGLGLLVVDHDMRLIARLCDRVVVLDHGNHIAAGRPDDVLRDPRVAELYLKSGGRTDNDQEG